MTSVHSLRSSAALIGLLVASVQAGAITLPDTRADLCYSDLEKITCPQEGWRFYGQDAEYEGTRSEFVDNFDGTVTDQTTGLVWDKSDDGVTRNWQEAFDYCINRNAKLPSLYQLETIIDYTRHKPATYSELDAQPTSEYWTKTTIKSGFPGLPDSAWLLHMNLGRSVLRDKEPYEKHYVRCVRGDWDLGLEKYLGFDGTTKDFRTGLLWQEEKGTAKTWEEALAYCEGLDLDYRNWRLPNIRELRSLLSGQRGFPAIDPDSFETEQAPYWTATTSADAANIAWVVDFERGNAWTTNGSKSNFHYTRCVAHGPASKYELWVDWDDESPFGPRTLKIISDPPGIDCEPDCNEAFDTGTEVTLTVQTDRLPIDSLQCNWWGMTKCNDESVCSFTMNRFRSIDLDCVDPLAKTKAVQSIINLILIHGVE